MSDGLNYDRSPIAAHRTRAEFTAPLRTWTPVISPSGALFYDGSLFPWRGDLIVGGLSSKGLLRLTVRGRAVTAEVVKESRATARLHCAKRPIVPRLGSRSFGTQENKAECKTSHP